MTICYFGIYDHQYPRNRILIEGLRRNGIQVIECNSRAKGLKKFFELYKRHKKVKGLYDILIVGFMGQLMVPFAKLLCRKRIVFDAFLSVYQSHVFDRKDIKPMSLQALYVYCLDWLSVRLADRVLLDTNSHIDYFVKTFHVKKEKFARIWIGAYDDIFVPSERQAQNERFKALWWGWTIPLHGVPYILEAASILKNENIDFVFVGDGEFKQGLPNVLFRGALKVKELVREIQSCDIALGIFGDTEKTRLVIPNKVYEAFACKKAVVTADTQAAREILEDGKHCLFCRAGDGRDLAKKILVLKNNPHLRKELAKNAYILYKEMFTPQELGRELKKIILELSPNV